jgi:hypothetical protein
MKLTLFSALMIAAAGFAVSNIETGDGLPRPTDEEWATRNRALVRAKVFRHDAGFDASRVDFTADPNTGVVDPTLTTCTYEPDAVSGTTPKFDCKLTNGETVKVKYGYTKEIPSEIAATRLLHALGFGADRVSRVETVRCYGCPFQPFHMRALWEMVSLTNYMDKRLDYSRYRDFTHVSVERNLDGEAIEAGPERGWAFYELKHIDPRQGGATRAEVDALRLIAVFLHHWDNKTANQRLTCPDAETAANCTQPLAMIQDVGSNFGPKKPDINSWRSRPVWADDRSCTLSMASMPYDGGTFEPVQIGDEGRRLLGERLQQLSRAQIESLFHAAGFDDVAQWTAVFEDKVRQITAHQACAQSSVVSRQ